MSVCLSVLEVPFHESPIILALSTKTDVNSVPIHPVGFCEDDDDVYVDDRSGYGGGDDDFTGSGVMMILVMMAMMAVFQGTLVGGVCGLGFALWLSVGAYLTTPLNFKLPTSTAGCNVTANITMTVLSTMATNVTTLSPSDPSRL